MPKWEETLAEARRQLEKRNAKAALMLFERAHEEVVAEHGEDHCCEAEVIAEIANAHIWYRDDRESAAAALHEAARIIGRLPDDISIVPDLADIGLNLFIVGEVKRAHELALRAHKIFMDTTTRRLDVRKSHVRSAATELLLSLNMMGLSQEIGLVVGKFVAPLLKRNKLAHFALDEIQLLGLSCERALQAGLAGQFYRYATDMLAHEKHPEQFNFGEVLAQVAQQLENFGKPDNALVLFHYAEVVQRQVFGHDHPHCLWAITRLIQKYIQHGELQKAELMIVNESERQIYHLPDHPDKAAFYNFLGYYSSILGDFDTAQLLLSQGVRMLERMHGWDSPKMAPALLDLGRVYYQQSRYYAAIRNLERSLELQLDNRRFDPDMLLDTFEWLATVLWWEESALNVAIGRMTVFERREYIKPDKLERRIHAGIRRLETKYRRAVVLLQKKEGRDGGHRIKLMTAMADFYIHFQRLDKAEVVLDELRKLVEKMPGDQLARVIVNSRCGIIYRAKRAVKKAEKCLKAAIAEAEKLDAEQAMYYRADSYRELGRVQLVRRDHAGALPFFEEAAALFSNLTMDGAAEATLEEMLQIHDALDDRKGARRTKRRLNALRRRED
ncbi:MAG: tetratricopeptide repeat protein [Candidatus Lernaella stagnicola]|nr:tetratricopeptide repeat protein [Candidatus Lernaella stagnicola]